MSKKQQTHVERAALLSLSFIAFAVIAFTANLDQAKANDTDWKQFLGVFKPIEGQPQSDSCKKIAFLNPREGSGDEPTGLRLILSAPSKPAEGEWKNKSTWVRVSEESKLDFKSLTNGGSSLSAIRLDDPPSATPSLKVYPKGNDMLLDVKFKLNSQEIQCRYSRPRQN